MGLLARNPQHDQREQGSGESLGGPPWYATGEVHHDAVTDDGVVHHVQRFEEGHLVEWAVTGEPGPWALVRSGPPEQPCPTGTATPDDLATTKVRIGERELVMPPLDDMEDPRFADLETFPDATARLRFEVGSSPVGRVLCDVRYVDGRRPRSRVVASWSETTPDEPAHGAPEIHVGVTFANYLRMRTGESSALEAIADGGTVGDTRWTLLLLLHGIYQQPRYVEIYRSLPVIPPELGWWGEAAPFVASDARPR